MGGKLIEYSLALLTGYVAAKWASPRFPSLKNERFHFHHWMWASILLLLTLWQGWTPDWFVGGLVGIALQVLSYKNWVFTSD